MAYALAITAVIIAVVLVALYSPRERRQRQVLQEFGPGETLASLTADLEVAMVEAVRELDICQPYIMRDNSVGLSGADLKKRVGARRKYIIALEAWRKAEECLDFNGTNGNIDLRMIGSIPLVRRAGINKAKESAALSRDLQAYIRLQGWME